MKKKTSGAQINPRGEDRHQSTLYLVLKGKAKHIHTRKKCESSINSEYTWPLKHSCVMGSQSLNVLSASSEGKSCP